MVYSLKEFTFWSTTFIDTVIERILDTYLNFRTGGILIILINSWILLVLKKDQTNIESK